MERRNRKHQGGAARDIQENWQRYGGVEGLAELDPAFGHVIVDEPIQAHLFRQREEPKGGTSPRSERLQVAGDKLAEGAAISSEDDSQARNETLIGSNFHNKLAGY